MKDEMKLMKEQKNFIFSFLYISENVVSRIQTSPIQPGDLSTHT